MNTALVNEDSLVVAEREVLAALRKSEKELSPSELVKAVLRNSPQLNDVNVKRAVWQLLSKAQIRLSDEQLLSVAQENGKEAA